MTQSSPVAGDKGVVSASSEAAVRAGLRMLEAGGNAVDAVVAAGFAAYVEEIASCGVGGYGHLAVYLSGEQRFVSIDHGVRAPLAAEPSMFALDPSGTESRYDLPLVAGRRNELGGLAVGTPGAVAGLLEAHVRFGHLTLLEALEPAIEAADAGVSLSWFVALHLERCLPGIAERSAGQLLSPDGRAPPVGTDIYDTSALAETLRRIARSGSAGFYEGEVAASIVSAVRQAGGILTRADLEGYRVRVTMEAPVTYRGLRCGAGPEPLGYEIISILEALDVASDGPDSLRYRHVMAEALAHAFSDVVTHYGDPDFVRTPVRALSGSAFGATRAAGISLDRAARRPISPSDPWPFEPPSTDRPTSATQPSSGGISGTSDVSVIDSTGNAASLITTLDGPFGSQVYAEESGVMLNNGMQDFDPRPGRPNSIAPGKRPLFAAPVVVAAQDGQAVLAISGSGGYRIAGAVMHALANVVDFGMGAQAACEAPRVISQGRDLRVDARIPADVKQGLVDLGHAIDVCEQEPVWLHFARVSAVCRDPATQAITGGGDPSWITSVGAC